MNTKEIKKQLRQEIISKRESLSETDWKEKSKKI